MDRDYQLGQDLKDELIPLAYEYFLNVIEHQSDDEGSSDLDGADSNENGSDGETKEKPKKKKANENEEKECKQQ